MKNLHLIFFLFFSFFSTTLSANKKNTYDPNVSIQILNITTNGLVLPNNTISFNGVSDLEVEFDVKITYTGANSVYFQGNASAYFYEPNSFDNEVAENYNNGVAPMYLFKKFLTLTTNGSSYSYTFHKKIHLKRNTVYNTGCSIVFRYTHDKTASIPSTTLSKLTYNIIGGTKTSNQPYVPPTVSVNLNSISYSNGLPLVNNEIVIPKSDQVFDDEETATRSINLSFDFNVTHGSDLVLGYYPHIKIFVNNTSYISEWYEPTDTHGTFTFNNFKIKASDITLNSYLKIAVYFQGTSTYYDCALVKLSNPIRDNLISQNQSIPIGQTIQPFTSNQPTIWTSGGNCPKLRIECNDPRVYSPINSYQWQTKTENGIWTNILGANNKEYFATNSFNQTTYFRRLAFYNGLYNISNEIVIDVSTTNYLNSICCNQNLPTSTSQPQTITGNSVTNNLTYQWQMSNNPRTTSWVDLPGETYQNCNGCNYPTGSRNSTILFQRLLKNNGTIVSTSNTITVTRGINARMANTNSNSVIVYPNPTSDFLFIKNMNTNTDYIKLFNSLGKEINIEKLIVEDNILQINVEFLPSGYYYLSTSNDKNDLIKIFKE
ncbi:T9SS type A sorting domain-containing protein [Flavobacterium macrobrachii]|uniref:T9SS type A sorting domain-containing protein n=1 Tax=Flavobacterium macrobrachii TaxID=591204 RepID=A0ABS2CZT9_9FLAO|nr:T9SS type A sorting domain-containing protein [Flavobacterium macrobrachii]MBM6500477.1 T9SS type A sorting domain-containing protein [Flavobacterium macrobrachii]